MVQQASGTDIAGAARSGAILSQAEIDRAADAYVQAVNARDIDALVASFAPDGVVVDVTRHFVGDAAIRRWALAEVIGGSLKVLDRKPSARGTTLLVHWTPAGMSGFRANYSFTIDAASGRIGRADLQYAD